MVKPGFTPTLLVGVGEMGAGIIRRVRELTSHWPQALQDLLQILQVEESAEHSRCRILQQSLSRLKAGKTLCLAEQEAEVQIRRQFGPLEINVYLIGQLGTAPDGSSLDAVFRELQSLEFSWSAAAGCTGATITTLTALGGAGTDQALVLGNLVDMYRNEEFLDAFGGRILLVDQTGGDGSMLDWQDVHAALARCLYTSLFPGDEPLLLPELGLIRKQEKAAKLATLGISCCYLPWREKILSLARNWLEQRADTLAAGENCCYQGNRTDSPFLRALNLAGLLELLQQQNLIADTVLYKLTASLGCEVNRRIAGPEPRAAQQFLTDLDYRLRELQDEVYEQCRILDRDFRDCDAAEPVFREPVPIIVEEYVEPGAKRSRIRYVVFGAVGLAAIYRLTANHILPMGLGLGLSGIVLSVGALLMFFGRAREEHPQHLCCMTSRPCEQDQPLQLPPVRTDRNETVKQRYVLDKLLVLLGDLLRESAKWQQGIACLARACRRVAKELRTEDYSLLNRPVDLAGTAWEPEFPAGKMLLPDWHKRNEAELKEMLSAAVVQQIKPFPEISCLHEILLEGWLNESREKDIQPLLMLKPGTKPLRRLDSLGCSPKQRERIASSPGYRIVAGPSDMICQLTFYFGIEPSQLFLQARGSLGFPKVYALPPSKDPDI